MNQEGAGSAAEGEQSRGRPGRGGPAARLAHFEEIQELTGTGSWDYDIASGELFWSPEVYRIFELDPRRFSPSFDGYLALIHPDDRAVAQETYGESLASGRAHDSRLRLLMPDGRVKHLHGRWRTFLGPDGRPERTVGALREITALVEWERMQSLYSHALATSPAAAGFADADGRLVWVNDAFLRMWRCESPAQVLGRPIVEFSASPETARTVESLKEGRGRTGKIIAKRTDGSKFDASLVSSAVRDPSGRIVGLLGQFVDVTEQEEATRRLAESEARYRRLFESIRDAVVSVGMDGRLREWNQVFQEMLGYTAGELSRLGWAELTPARWHAREEGILSEQVLVRGCSEVYEKELTRSDGTILPVELRTFLVLDADGRPGCSLAIVRDVTERHAARAALLEAERRLQEGQRLDALGRLAAGIAHDFNNALGVVIGLGSLLEQKLQAVPEALPLVRDVSEAAARAADLTRQLLTFARTRQDELVEVDVASRIDAILGLVARTLGEHITLVTEVGRDLGVVRIGPSHLDQILMNLALNARDAMQAGGRLTIRAERFACREPGPNGGCPCVRIEVADTGAGMSSEIQERIFEPFFTTKAEGFGAGLGLPTVYAIVRKAGGTITVESSPGSGATFRVDLPLSGPTPTGARPGPAEVDLHGTETVLLVEDDPMTLDVISRILEGAGHRVLKAANATEAVAAVVREGRVDLLVSDVVLPGRSGPALFRDLAREVPGLPVIFVSGYAPDAVAIERLGHLVAKPFDAGTLLRAVRSVLDSAGRRSSTEGPDAERR